MTTTTTTTTTTTMITKYSVWQIEISSYPLRVNTSMPLAEKNLSIPRPLG